MGRPPGSHKHRPPESSRSYRQHYDRCQTVFSLYPVDEHWICFRTWRILLSIHCSPGVPGAQGSLDHRGSPGVGRWLVRGHRRRRRIGVDSVMYIVIVSIKWRFVTRHRVKPTETFFEPISKRPLSTTIGFRLPLKLLVLAIVQQVAMAVRLARTDRQDVETCDFQLADYCWMFTGFYVTSD
jgi:hypothetical protein